MLINIGLMVLGMCLASLIFLLTTLLAERNVSTIVNCTLARMDAEERMRKWDADK